MATTVNNTTVNSKLSIIFDAGVNPNSQNDGPASGTGNTESDVMIDNVTYHNVRSHTEVPSEIHCLQWNASTNTGWYEYTDTRENLDITSLPQWATNVVIRCEAEDIYTSTYNTENESNDVDRIANASTTAETARNNYLSGHSITY